MYGGFALAEGQPGQCAIHRLKGETAISDSRTHVAVEMKCENFGHLLQDKCRHIKLHPHKERREENEDMEQATHWFTFTGWYTVHTKTH